MTINYLKVPKESANDTEVILREIHLESGEWKEEGEIVFEVEGQKTIYEVIAINSGYIYFIDALAIDETYQVDEVIALISEQELDDKLVKLEFDRLEAIEDGASKAIETINFAKKIPQNNRSIKRIGVIGGGQGFSQIIEINESLSEPYEIVCIYDDGLFDVVNQKYRVPVIGAVETIEIINDYHFKFIDGLVISVSTSNILRQKWFDLLSPHVPFVNFIHKDVVIPKEINIGSGNVLLPRTHIGINSEIGNNNFISSFCNIEHHCVLGSHNTFGPNVTMSGDVKVDDSVKFGTGIFIEPKIHVSSNQFVKSFQLINKDI